MSSSVDSDDTVQQKKPKTKHRKRAPKKFENEEQRRDFLERNRLGKLLFYFSFFFFFIKLF